MKLNDNTVGIICKGLEKGLSVVAVCGIANISEATYYRWKKEHHSFAMAVQASQYRLEEMAIGKIIEAGDKDWRALAWILERRHPKSWKYYEEVKVDAKNDGSNVVLSWLKQIRDIQDDQGDQDE